MKADIVKIDHVKLTGCTIKSESESEYFIDPLQEIIEKQCFLAAKSCWIVVYMLLNLIQHVTIELCELVSPMK